MSLWLRFQVKETDLSPFELFEKKLLFKQHIENSINLKEKNYELWNKEILEELNGELLYKNKNFEFLMNKINSITNFEMLIQKTNGNIIKVNGEKINLAFILYNIKKYRKIYGDIEIDATNQSFEELFLKNRDFKKSILQSIIELKPKKIDVQSCIVGESPDSLHDVRERIFTYHPRARYFIEDILRTIRYWSEEKIKENFPSDKPKLNWKTYFAQFNLEHLALLIEKETKFDNYCKGLTRKYGIHFSKGSIILDAEKKEAFQELFNFIKNDFEKVRQQWYTDKQLKQVLRKWFEGQQLIDEDFE